MQYRCGLTTVTYTDCSVLSFNWQPTFFRPLSHWVCFFRSELEFQEFDLWWLQRHRQKRAMYITAPVSQLAVCKRVDTVSEQSNRWISEHIWLNALSVTLKRTNEQIFIITFEKKKKKQNLNNSHSLNDMLTHWELTIRSLQLEGKEDFTTYLSAIMVNGWKG